MMCTVRFGDNDYTNWLYCRFKCDEERIEALEDRVDELSDALVALAGSVMGCKDVMSACKFILCGYSEGENTYPEVE